jgi:hypothetical protein
MKTFYDNDDVEDLLHGDVYEIPENIKNIKIDVGLAGEAPNSAIWLSETNDRYVFGFEPLVHHWSMLTNFDLAETTRVYPDDFKILQLHDKTIKLNRNIVCDITNRFTGIRCAIDNVNKITEMDFYEMDRHLGASGSSSLLPPSNQHPWRLNDVIKIKTFSLEMFLKNIPWDRFEFIEHIKTDCEGKDFDVVKSIGKYLHKVVFITSEMTNNRHHVIGSCDPNEFINFMIQNDFTVSKNYGGNIDFVNNRFINTDIIKTLNNNTLGF